VGGTPPNWTNREGLFRPGGGRSSRAVGGVVPPLRSDRIVLDGSRSTFNVDFPGAGERMKTSRTHAQLPNRGQATQMEPPKRIVGSQFGMFRSHQVVRENGRNTAFWTSRVFPFIYWVLDSIFAGRFSRMSGDELLLTRKSERERLGRSGVLQGEGE
jgi:hypothetical protein